MLDAARLVIVVPGYGLAVAQAQHKLREMYDLLTRRGARLTVAGETWLEKLREIEAKYRAATGALDG